MKFNTILTVFAVAIACAVSGCRYDRAGKGARGAGAGDGDNGNISDIESGIVDGDLDEGSLDSIKGDNFWDKYQKCTDVDFAPVYFGFDSTVIPDGEMGKIDAVADHLAEHADRVVVVEGNCDERGSNEYNMSLGENRAITIRNYLIQSGVSDDRIQTRSFGEENPAVAGSDEDAYAKNRRGEFSIYQK